MRRKMSSIIRRGRSLSASWTQDSSNQVERKKKKEGKCLFKFLNILISSSSWSSWKEQWRELSLPSLSIQRDFSLSHFSSFFLLPHQQTLTGEKSVIRKILRQIFLLLERTSEGNKKEEIWERKRKKFEKKEWERRKCDLKCYPHPSTGRRSFWKQSLQRVWE